MALRPYWTGQIQISLVQFGVKLYVATEAKSEIHFHQISRATGERVRHQKVLASAADTHDDHAGPDAVVEKDEIVKGYEYSKGEYVTIEPKELEQLRVPSKHTMEISQFVDASEIDPEFYEKPYFVVPENDAQAQAFAVVRQALKETKKVALTKIAFAGREHIVALTPTQDDTLGGMMAYTMRYAQELRDPKEYFADVKKASVDADSLSLAKELIKRKAGRFDPEKFVDGYEVALKELVDAKVAHAPVPKDEAPAPARGKVINLMDALRKSVAGDEKATPKKTATKTAAKGIALVKASKPAAKTAKRKSA
ncbi:DNA end-binding protein Ku [Granulicella pectinivorans]|uniref:Non-homologous end joining protein Ku n=1 Tax=Granulicella pectinivorans TaxID=474950 RepID=A0A1I6MHM6_9BACT|nr:Ku protein [Granulicella pectinivorans]SFS15121.1 DNA end-binding protein Ku [Granulicella pectinivorans]